MMQNPPSCGRFLARCGLYLDSTTCSIKLVIKSQAEAPWRLALVTVMQYMEGLSDRQAAEAVRERIDWKYTLGLELTDPGFDFVRHVT
jgi:transposase